MEVVSDFVAVFLPSPGQVAMAVSNQPITLPVDSARRDVRKSTPHNRTALGARGYEHKRASTIDMTIAFIHACMIQEVCNNIFYIELGNGFHSPKQSCPNQAYGKNVVKPCSLIQNCRANLYLPS